MIRSCLVCSISFPENEVLERLPRGHRLAFDGSRGRLWVVCPNCRRWSLVPLEDRWEAIEELERAVRDRGRVLSSTDTISLIKVGPLEVVRVGGASRTEEAWWRYGRELVQRRRSYGRLTVAAGAASAAVVAGGWATGGISFFGAWWLWSQAPDGIKRGARWLRFGSAAWRGRSTCDRCGHEFTDISFKERQNLVLLPHREQPGQFAVGVRCPRCQALEDGGLRLEDRAAERTLQRVLAYHHFDGASEQRVRSASRLIEEAGSARALTRILLRGGRRVGDLQRTGAIALEISANESTEQRVLEMELAELEAVWRKEEELAQIIDDELTDVPLLESFRRTVLRKG